MRFVVTPPGEFAEAAKNVARSLRLPVQYTDKDGYEYRIIAAAIHPEFEWKAWVEERHKLIDNNNEDYSFTLKIMKAGRIVHTWIVETYNPYFGCRVGFMQWVGEHIITIYREKHSTYICSIGSDYNYWEVYFRIADNWIVKGSVVYFVDGVWSKTDTGTYEYSLADQIERKLLPHLTVLPPITKTEAKELGI